MWEAIYREEKWAQDRMVEIILCLHQILELSMIVYKKIKHISSKSGAYWFVEQGERECRLMYRLDCMQLNVINKQVQVSLIVKFWGMFTFRSIIPFPLQISVCKACLILPLVLGLFLLYIS